MSGGKLGGGHLLKVSKSEGPEPSGVWQQKGSDEQCPGLSVPLLAVSVTNHLLCASLWQVMLLIDIELAYMNTNHEDFIGFAK